MGQALRNLHEMDEFLSYEEKMQVIRPYARMKLKDHPKELQRLRILVDKIPLQKGFGASQMMHEKRFVNSISNIIGVEFVRPIQNSESTIYKVVEKTQEFSYKLSQKTHAPLSQKSTHTKEGVISRFWQLLGPRTPDGELRNSRKPHNIERSFIDTMTLFRAMSNQYPQTEKVVTEFGPGIAISAKNEHDIYLIPSRRSIYWKKTGHLESYEQFFDIVSEKVSFQEKYVPDDSEFRPLSPSGRMGQRILDNKQEKVVFKEVKRLDQMHSGDQAKCHTPHGLYHFINIRGTKKVGGHVCVICTVRCPSHLNKPDFEGAVTLPLRENGNLLILDEAMMEKRNEIGPSDKYFISTKINSILYNKK